MPRSLLSITIAVVSIVRIASAETTIENAVASMPTTVGGVTVSIPSPLLTGGHDEAAESKALERAAGKHAIDRFIRDSIVAPFTFQRTSIKDADGKRIGHQVDVWFVAYGALEAIAEKDLFATLVKAADQNRDSDGAALDPDTLQKREITDAGVDAEDPVVYYRFSTSILNRVAIQGVARRTLVQDQGALFAAVAVDPRFRDDDDFPNRWRDARKDNSEWSAYGDCGGYAIATPLLGHDGALLIECHAMVHEPTGWFGGANLLGSKLPLAVQNAVRDFRRALAKKD